MYREYFGMDLPADAIKQIKTIPAVAADSLMLIGWLSAAVILFSLLFIWLLFKVRTKIRIYWPIFFMLILIPGWYVRSAKREIVTCQTINSSALPRYIQSVFGYFLRFNSFEPDFLTVMQQFPPVRPGYKRIIRNSIEVVPIETLNQESPGKKYNVILVQMESVRAIECGFMGAEISFTPQLDEITKSSLRFTNFYANGIVSARGELAILGSLYPNPFGNPLYLFNTQLKIIALPDILAQKEYQTIWFNA